MKKELIDKTYKVEIRKWNWMNCKILFFVLPKKYDKMKRSRNNLFHQSGRSDRSAKGNRAYENNRDWNSGFCKNS